MSLELSLELDIEREPLPRVFAARNT
jgi:hypothetical protein